jgi:outer membrane lipase/esterase
LRRAWLLAACASSLVLAACGGGSIESQLHPTRIVAFGDAFADLGQNGARYTVNDGSVNNWTQFVANAFAVPLAPSAGGGTSYARGTARVLAKPDASGNAATLTVKEQIDTYLAGQTFNTTDLVIVNAGIADVTVQAHAAITGAQTRDQMLAAVGQAGRDLGTQVRRLVQAGAIHVVVVGPYNLGRSPWALQLKQESLLLDASSRFNEQMLVSIVDLGANVLYVDAALYLNLVSSAPTAYEFNNATEVLCNSIDVGAGIGTGAGQVNSNLCNSGTLASTDTKRTMWADRIYPTPLAHRLFGEYAYNRIKERW